MFNIYMGIPEMNDFWKDLVEKNKNNPSKSDALLFKKIVKTLKMISNNPRHPGLKSHEIDALTNRYGIKVWESYIENNTPGAGRIFWVYGPERTDITIIGLEPHPNDKNNAYKKITLSSMNETNK